MAVTDGGDEDLPHGVRRDEQRLHPPHLPGAVRAGLVKWRPQDLDRLSRLPHEADEVVDADGVTLRAPPLGEVRGIAILGIATLRASPVDVQPSSNRQVPRRFLPFHRRANSPSSRTRNSSIRSSLSAPRH